MAETTSRSPTATTTSAMTLPSLTDFTVRWNWLRALSMIDTVLSFRVAANCQPGHLFDPAGMPFIARGDDLQRTMCRIKRLAVTRHGQEHDVVGPIRIDLRQGK